MLHNPATAIETAISPVILISANSLFLLTLTNRYSNVTNRLRQLTHIHLHQVETLYKRVLAIKCSIIFAVLSLTIQIGLILLILLASALDKDSTFPAVCLFALSLVLMLASSVSFTIDMCWSSSAVTEYTDTLRRRAFP
jgi:hypothetical protein